VRVASAGVYTWETRANASTFERVANVTFWGLVRDHYGRTREKKLASHASN